MIGRYVDFSHSLSWVLMGIEFQSSKPSKGYLFSPMSCGRWIQLLVIFCNLIFSSSLLELIWFQLCDWFNKYTLFLGIKKESKKIQEYLRSGWQQQFLSKRPCARSTKRICEEHSWLTFLRKLSSRKLFTILMKNPYTNILFYIRKCKNIETQIWWEIFP